MLPVAVMEGDLNFLKRILDTGDENNKLSHGTCVCLAARKRRGDIVQLLIEHGFDVDQEDAQGHSAIYYSATQNDLETTELLLQNGAKVDEKYDLIFFASRKGFGNIVKVLVDFGANVNAKDELGQTPLHHAILQDSAVFTFLKESVKTNISQMENVVHHLLSNGADVNAKTVNGFSPLHFAIQLKYASVVSTLLDHGADYHSLFNCDIKSPKLSQFRRKSNRSVTLGRLTMKPRLTTVLHIAADSNDVASLNLLLKAGAHVDSVQHDGTTPLIVAIQSQHDTIVKALLDFGADVEQKTKYGFTPLHVACRNSSLKVLSLLLKAGANINSMCNKGKVPYQYVSQLEAEAASECCGENVYDMAPHYLDRRYLSITLMKQFLHIHCVLMDIIGCHLQAYNKKVAMKTPNVYRRLTKKQIEEFSKTVIIHNNVSLYRVIDERRNPFYIRNPNLLKGLGDAIAAANTKYPGLDNVVMFLVKSARVRVNLIEIGIKKFINFNRRSKQLPTLPFEVLEIVFSFLLNEEIENFISCGIS